MDSGLQEALMGIETGLSRSWWTTPQKMTGGKMVSPVVFVSSALTGYFHIDNPWQSQRKAGIARIAVGELKLGLSFVYLKELWSFKILLRVMEQDLSSNYDTNLNGESYIYLYKKYLHRVLDEENETMRKIYSLDLVANNDFTIKRISSYKEMQFYGDYTFSNSPWCVSFSEKKFNALSAGGNNTLFVVLNKDYQLISEQDGFKRCKNYLQTIKRATLSPYDDYGLSMILLAIAPDSTLVSCTSRWNHAFPHSTHDYLDEFELSMLLGRNYFEIFKHIV